MEAWVRVPAPRSKERTVVEVKTLGVRAKPGPSWDVVFELANGKLEVKAVVGVAAGDRAQAREKALDELRSFLSEAARAAGEP